MDRFAQALGSMVLVASTLLHVGCSNNASGLTTAGLSKDAPGSFDNTDPNSRPVGVAWTSARAKRCGFYFDPAKLKINYLAYERTQGAAADQLAKIEKTYDTTFRVTSEKVAGDPDYCTDSRGLEIKAELQRHLAGDYAPNLPKPKAVASCGFFGCTESQSDKPFSSKEFWAQKDKDPKGRGR
jgi:hypothetical protein